MGRKSWFVGLALLVSACASEPPPEGECTGTTFDGSPAEDPSCSSITPICASVGPPDYSRRCTARCASDADCEYGGTHTSCDPMSRLCNAPCTEDRVGLFACVDGERQYCESDASLPCTICNLSCAFTSYCDTATMACVPRRATGATCSTSDQCASFSCFGGVCAARQGEVCTPETCDGACAMTSDGTAYCVQNRAPDNCNTRTDLGLRWRAITYSRSTGDTVQCFPIETCSWEGSCRTFQGGRCGQSCGGSGGGGCFTFCIPSELYPGD